MKCNYLKKKAVTEKADFDITGTLGRVVCVRKLTV